MLCLAARTDRSQLLSGCSGQDSGGLYGGLRSILEGAEEAHGDMVRSPRWPCCAPDAMTVISGGAAAMLRVWNVETGMETRPSRRRASAGAAGGPNERYYTAARERGLGIGAWRPPKRCARSPARRCRSTLSPSPDGARLASSSMDKTYRLEPWARRRQGDGRDQCSGYRCITAIGYHHDGSLLPSRGLRPRGKALEHDRWLL